MSWLTPDLIDILLTILKAVVILLVVVTCGAFMSFGERRLLGLFQNRYGPNRVGWGGSLQLVADMIKMFFKEDWIPKFSDRVIFTLAPMIAFTSLLLAFAIVPVSPTWVVALRCTRCCSRDGPVITNTRCWVQCVLPRRR